MFKKTLSPSPFLLLSISLIWLFTVSGASANNDPAPEPPGFSVKPLSMMAKLSDLAGIWDMQTLYSADAGKNWQDMGTTHVEIMYEQRNMMLSERPLTAKKTGFNMVSFITYDQYRNVYRKAAIDDVWGIMDLYSGNIKDNKLVLTNLESGTTFPEQGGGSRGFRLTLELSGDRREMTVEATLDNGKTWFPNFKNVYVRQSAN